MSKMGLGTPNRDGRRADGLMALADRQEGYLPPAVFVKAPGPDEYGAYLPQQEEADETDKETS
jgi:hypothetical protein